VQDQLEENKKLARSRRYGAAYLLQGLLVCQCCHYAYGGKRYKARRNKKIDHSLFIVAWVLMLIVLAAIEFAQTNKLERRT
jgi:hypothetical protein